MNEWLDILKQFGLQIAPWTLVFLLVVYIFRERVGKALDALLGRFGNIFRGEWSYRRFERIFRPATRTKHLYMHLVGFGDEKVREPTITEAYVPLRLAPYVDANARDTNRSSNKLAAVRNAQANPSLLSYRDRHWSIEDVLQMHTTLVVVLGDPGAGKSTLLKYLITRFTKPREDELTNNILPPDLLSLKHPQRRKPIIPCPLYVSLRSCRTENKTLLDDITADQILDSMLPSDQHQQMPSGFIKNCVKNCVKKGRAILLLDGLDEVEEAMYNDVVRKINDFHSSYPKNRIVVTCRIAGWHSGLRGKFALYQPLPLDRQQQHDFITLWYKTAYKLNESNESSTLLEKEKLAGLDLLRDEQKLKASEAASALERLFGERERLVELATNPMLLSLICLVYHQRRDLPRGRAALYNKCVEILLDVWDRRNKGLNISKPTTDEKCKILRHVAYLLHSSGQKDISRQDFESLVMNDLGVNEETARIIVRQIEVRSWLIVERVIDRLAFSHLTLQEFFVVEYMHTEKHDAINFATINDWNIWGELLLLMCGQSTDPTTFIEQIAPHKITLAILCIGEADSTLLDVQRINHLLDDALRQVREDKLALIDLLPALVSLPAIEEAPFITQIIDFMKMYLPTLDEVSQSNRLKTIAGSTTREAARLLLYLHLIVPDKWQEVLNGLVLIGDKAVEEALQWNGRGELSDDKLSELLLDSDAPEATLALWKRNGSEPGREMDEIAWAASWASRLTLAENERLMRETHYDGPIDAEIWPYRKSQRTALAAIVQKCVQILRGVYKGNRYGDTEQERKEFVDSIEVIAHLDPRVQIPLLIQPKYSQIEIKEKTDKKRIEAVLGNTYFPEKHAWYALVRLEGGESKNSFWYIAGKGIGILGQLGSCVLLWAGVVIWTGVVIHLPNAPSWPAITILLPNVPVWLAIITGIVVLPCLLLSFTCAIALLMFIVFLVISAPILVIMVPILVNPHIYVWVDDGQEIARMIATKKVNFWYPLTLLITAVVYGVLGGFAVHAWFHLALPLSMLVVGLGCLLFNILYGWTSALLVEPMRPWLERHPRGQVVLNELQG